MIVRVREYLLYVPNNYNPELKYPLMINFHGFGGYAKDFVNEADMRNLAEDQNFLVVYPQDSFKWITSLEFFSSFSR